MAQLHEWLFYEVMWRLWTRRLPYPFPWWVQQYFRRWTDVYDAGLFDSKEAAFASNANYRYWNMVGQPNQDLESLVGQAGEVEPVYDQYSLSIFVFDPVTRTLHFPEMAGLDGRLSTLRQELLEGWLPVVVTRYGTGAGVAIRERVLGTQVSVSDDRGFVLVRVTAELEGTPSSDAWLCVSVSPAGPTGFQRHDRSGRIHADRRLAFLRYVAAERRVELNATWGPSFDSAPAHFGVYGNQSSQDPDFYLRSSPFTDLSDTGSLNGLDSATDSVAGLCHGVFAWPMHLTAAQPDFQLDLRLPVGPFANPADLAEMGTRSADEHESWVVSSWAFSLFREGMRIEVPPGLQHLADQEALSRSQLMILADRGEIHPGPTIYDSFWIRDSSVEGIACALVGQEDLAEAQFGTHYPKVFNRGAGRIGPVSLNGFFGGEHERNDREWDANGQALWAIGRFDRIKGPGFAFGQGMFSPYVIDGARWIRDNRSSHGLLHDGWSAEHLGDKGNPHYWDDLWGLAGLWEAAQMAERIGAPPGQRVEMWQAYDDLRTATVASIRWVLGEQRRQGHWETFVPTGPADVGRLDSTLIGAVAYFHPCRLYMGAKLGGDIDLAMRQTLDTIWGHFVEGGFRHDSAWNAYGPYLTLQLAHAFLFLGDLERMNQLLAWTAGPAAFSTVSRPASPVPDKWQVALGAWNEQHCYPIATDFAWMPDRHWYMGDMPHGWACAEFILLLRDMLFFEADEDADPHLLLLPGILPSWLSPGETLRVQRARTCFGGTLDLQARHLGTSRTVELLLSGPRADVRYEFHCRFGSGVAAAVADGEVVPVDGPVVRLPPGTRTAQVTYL